MSNKAIITCDLGFGDSGKGATVDILARVYDAKTVVRFNGGAQCAHNVIHNGKHHTFAQFGSASFIPDVKTFLSEFVLVNPISALREESVLKQIGVDDPMDRLHIDARSIITTPFHIALNKIKEMLRGDKRHGSCGMGIGETIADQIISQTPLTVYQLFRPHLKDKLAAIRNRLVPQLLGLRNSNRERFESDPLLSQEECIFFDDNYLDIIFELYMEFRDKIAILCSNNDVKQILKGTSIFESAQGILLDEDFGFYPYNTWTNTRTDNAFSILKKSEFDGNIISLGIMRAYMTRHGAGPLPTEDKELTKDISESHNGTNEWQGNFRAGWLDLAAIKYALDVNSRKFDYLVVNHVDQLQLRNFWFIGENYELDGQKIMLDDKIKHNTDVSQQLMKCKVNGKKIPKNDVLLYIKDSLNIPIAITGHGPTSDDRVFCLNF